MIGCPYVCFSALYCVHASACIIASSFSCSSLLLLSPAYFSSLVMLLLLLSSTGMLSSVRVNALKYLGELCTSCILSNMTLVKLSILIFLIFKVLS
jgi:hypothetical protein